MSFFITKTVLATLLIAAGLTAALSMLTIMGGTERKASAAALRSTHRIAGYVFAVLLVLLALMGLRYLSTAGDSLSVRGVLHWSLASLLVFVLALKLVIVRRFKQFIKYVPVIGMTAITLTLVVAMLSAVFFVVTGGLGRSGAWNTGVREDELEVVVVAAPEKVDVDVAEGERTFVKYCSGCHYADSTDEKIAEGLAGLFARDEIEASGAPMSPENVRAQIVEPAGGMPSFKAYLSEQQLDDLIAYLMTL